MNIHFTTPEEVLKELRRQQEEPDGGEEFDSEFEETVSEPDDALVPESTFYDYKVTNHNGQEMWGPPPQWKGPVPKDTEVFVAGLPKNVDIHEVVNLFIAIGNIYAVRIMRTFGGECRGYGYVRYFNYDSALSAIKCFNYYKFHNHKLKVCKSVDNRTLYIDHVPTFLTDDEELQNILDEVITGKILKVFIMKDENTSLSKGFAFLVFNSHRMASFTLRELNGAWIEGWPQRLFADWACPPEFDDEPYLPIQRTMSPMLRVNNNQLKLQKRRSLNSSKATVPPQVWNFIKQFL